MGAGVSTDLEPIEINDLDKALRSKAPVSKGPSRCVRAWCFRKDAKAEAIALISVTPDALQADRSYLILSVTEPQEDIEIEDDIKRWAQLVFSIMTPRGISTPVTILDRFVGGLQCSVWVWNGVQSPWKARNGALLTAIRMDRKLKAVNSVQSLVDCATAHVNSCDAAGAPNALPGAIARGFRRLLGCVTLQSACFPNVRRELGSLSKVVPEPSDAPPPARRAFESPAENSSGTPRSSPVQPTQTQTHASRRQECGKVEPALKVVGLDGLGRDRERDRERDRDSALNSGRGMKRDSEALEDNDNDLKTPVKRTSMGLDLVALSKPQEPPDYGSNLPEKQQRQMELSQFRSVCSEIIPNELFVSGYSIPSNRKALRAHGITHILNTAGDVCKNLFEDDFTYLTYYLKDVKEEDISAMFYRTFNHIDKAIEANGRVLVHCREGVSRSCTLIIGYLMYRFRVDTITAFNKVRGIRGICNPNTGFYCQLVVLQKRLQITGRENGSSIDTKLSAYRVSPHDARQPFLVLLNFDYSRKVAVVPYDTRFGFVLRMGATILGWIGQGCPNKSEVRATIEEHAHWVEKFEGVKVDLQIFFEGEEPDTFWEWNQVARPGPPGFVGIRPDFDADMQVLVTLRDGVKSQCSTPRTPVSDDEPIVPGAQLFEAGELTKPIHRHDSDDLDPQKSFLLLVPETHELFLWIGDNASESYAHNAATKFLKGFADELNLIVIRQGAEPAHFWEYFEDG